MIDQFIRDYIISFLVNSDCKCDVYFLDKVRDAIARNQEFRVYYTNDDITERCIQEFNKLRREGVVVFDEDTHDVRLSLVGAAKYRKGLL